VKKDRIDGFRDLAKEGHLYLGARRVKGGLKPKEQQNVVRVLRRQDGKAYNKLGTTGDKKAHSCVSLVEFALDSIGRGTLSTFQELSIPTPYELYKATAPVNEITVDVGERITIPIYSAITHPSRRFRGRGQFAGFDNEFYTREMLFRELKIDSFYYEIAMNLKAITSSAATFRASSNPNYRLSFDRDNQLKPNGRVFKWTPEPKHADKSFPLPIQLDASPSLLVNGSRRNEPKVSIDETLTIHVRPCISEEEPNDTCEQATPMGKSRCATGAIPKREPSSRPQSPIIGTDRFKKTLAPGRYRATLDIEQASIEIEIEGESARAGRGELNFELKDTQTVCASVFTFTPVESYTLTIQELSDYCDTGFYFHNGTDSTIGFQLVASNIEPMPVSIPPGRSFEQFFDQELFNLNMIDFNFDGERVGGDGNMLFDLEVLCGRAQNFVWTEFLSFEQTPVFEPLEFFREEIAIAP
jgi:hypothetical protein